MGRRLFGANASNQAGRTVRGRWSAVALMLLAGLLVAGCAQRDGSAEKDRPGGFYGGMSTGIDM